MAHRNPQVLSANGSTTPVGTAGRYICAAVGTFGAGTLKVQYSPNDGTTWVDLASGSLTADGTFEVACGVGGLLRATLTGAAGPSISVSFGKIIV